MTSRAGAFSSCSRGATWPRAEAGRRRPASGIVLAVIGLIALTHLGERYLGGMTATYFGYGHLVVAFAMLEDGLKVQEGFEERPVKVKHVVELVAEALG